MADAPDRGVSAPAAGRHSTADAPGSVPAQAVGSLVELVNQDRLVEAEDAVRSVLQEHPASGILWKILSVTLVRQGKDAMQSLQRAAELMPGDAEALRNLGAAQHDRKQWSEALATLQKALALEPDNVDALIDAGNSMRALGRARESLALYRRATALDPRSAEACNNLGNAHLELGEYGDAAECYRQALGLRPRDAQILGNLSQALRQLGRLEEAATVARQAVDGNARLGEAHNALGLALAALGRHAEAAASYREAVQLDPGNVEALDNLGNVLRDMGDRRGAVPLYRQAIERNPQRPESHCNLGNVLFEMRQVEQAVASYRAALAIRPDYAPAHLGLAFALRQQRLPAQAEASCRAALAANPNYVEAIAFLGELHTDRGQFAEAQRLFQRAIEINPSFSFAYTSIATHRKMTREDTQWLQGAQALLSRPQPLGHEISLRYALGKYFDDVRQYDDAFAQYRQANELTRRFGVRYDRAALTRRLDKIISRFARGAAGAFQAVACGSDIPVLIVGMPRSGTSLAEQILASHPAVFGAGEVNFWHAGYDAFRDAERTGKDGRSLIPDLTRDYLQQLTAGSGGAARVVDKMPANFMYAGLIHAAFPRVRIIHMRRNPIDTCLSIYFQNFFNIGPYANDLDDLAHYYGEYVRITDHWRAVLPESALLEVSYEGLIAAQESWTRRILDFVGLPWDPKCLDFQQTDRVVITASRWQVRQKMNSASAGRWRHYEKHVGPLRHLLPDV